MEISWFFLLGFFLHYFSSFSFDNDAITFFKEGVAGKKKNLLNFKHYYCCKTFKLLLLLL
jgi:hypothetical protein